MRYNLFTGRAGRRANSEEGQLSARAGWLQETELLAAGFPCVDVSRQGLRKGMAGKVAPQPPQRAGCSVQGAASSFIQRPQRHEHRLKASIVKVCRALESQAYVTS